MMMRVIAPLCWLLLVCSFPAVQADLSELKAKQGSCPLLGLIPFSDERVHRKGDDPLPPAKMEENGVSFTAAMLLAMQHFNDRDASVVGDLSELPPECTVSFPLDETRVIDSTLDYKRSVAALLEASHQDKVPCSVIGPAKQLAVESTAFLTSTLQRPLISYEATGMWVTEPEVYTTTLRVTANDQLYVAQIVSYLQYIGRTHLVVVHQGSDKMTRPALYLERVARGAGIQVTRQVIAPPPPGTPPTAENYMDVALGSVKETGIKTLMLFYDTPTFGPSFADYATKHDLVGEDYLWLLHSDFATSDTIHYHYGHAPGMRQLLEGATIISRIDGFTRDPTSDPFLASWRSQQPDTVDRLNALLPPKQSTVLPSDYFQLQSPAEGSSYVYDSVMAVGIGACRAMQEEQYRQNASSATLLQPRQGRPPPGPPKTEDKPITHTWGIASSSFEGASGIVSFGVGRQPNTRDAAGLLAGAFNVRAYVDAPTNQTM